MSAQLGGVEITTLTVNLKIIQIGKKQMTLSVFRQLPREPVFDAVLKSTRGVIWGTVNYFWDACGCNNYRFKERTHIVWHREGTLYRSCLATGQGLCGELGGFIYCNHDYDNLNHVKPSREWLSFVEHVRQLDQLFIAV